MHTYTRIYYNMDSYIYKLRFYTQRKRDFDFSTICFPFYTFAWLSVTFL